MTTREQFFECTFSSGRLRRTALVRAWTAEDARRAFLDLLASDGIHEPGHAVVAPMRLERRVPIAVPGIPPPRYA